MGVRSHPFAISMQVSGKIYPNGEFGIAKVKKFTPEHVEVKPLTRKQQLKIEYLPIIGIEGLKAVDGEAEGSPPLGFVRLSNFTARAPRGSKGITRQSGRMVRNSAYLLQERYGAKHLSFVTLTLPSVTAEESVLISERWSRVVDNLREALVLRLARAGLPKAVVGVTEIQSQRTGRDGVLGLHLHLLFVGRRRYSSWVIKTEEIDLLWQTIITNQCPGNWDFSRACKMQQVKGSAAGYLSKYMSKGPGDIQKAQEDVIGACVPKAWHTMTRMLLRWTKESVITDNDLINSLWSDCFSQTPALCSFKKLIEIKVSEEFTYICGAYGKLKSEFLSFVKSEYTKHTVGMAKNMC